MNNLFNFRKFLSQFLFFYLLHIFPECNTFALVGLHNIFFTATKQRINFCLFLSKLHHVGSEAQCQHISLQIQIFSFLNTNGMTKMTEQFLIVLLCL